jgi:hypothetical protein
MKTTHALALLVIVLVAAAACGCLESPRKITNTVAPVTPQPTAEPTATPTPAPPAKPSVTVSGGTTTIIGNKDGVARDFRLGQGVYVVSWSGSGTYLSLSVNDLNGNGLADMSKGGTSGSRLLVVDGSSIYPGNFSLMATSDGDWKVTIVKPETYSAKTLPVTLGGSEASGAVSEPFYAERGIIRISYSFSHTATGNGYIHIYDILTGESFYTRPMSSGSQTGQSTAEVTVKGIYIAQADMPPGSSYGEITLSQ